MACSSRLFRARRSAAIARLRGLVESRAARERDGVFVVDGLKFVAEALSSPLYHLESLFVAPDLLLHPFGRTLLRRAEERRLPTLLVASPLFRALSRQEEPQGIGAVVHQRWDRLERLRPQGLWLALDTIRSPGNLGTMLRTLEAFGGAGVLLVGDSIDPFAPEVVRASMGAVFSLRFVRTSEEALAAWRAGTGFPLIGTSPDAAEGLDAFAFPAAAAVWMGSERTGLSAEQQAACSAVVRIPMAGRADSLNVASAAAILLYAASLRGGRR